MRAMGAWLPASASRKTRVSVCVRGGLKLFGGCCCSAHFILINSKSISVIVARLEQRAPTQFSSSELAHLHITMEAEKQRRARKGMSVDRTELQQNLTLTARLVPLAGANVWENKGIRNSQQFNGYSEGWLAMVGRRVGPTTKEGRQVRTCENEASETPLHKLDLISCATNLAI